MVLHFWVKLRIWGKKFFDRAVFTSPRLICIITRLTREEAIVRQELSTITRGQHNLIPSAFLAAPVFQGTV
jgi:hypothetical protein